MMELRFRVSGKTRTELDAWANKIISSYIGEHQTTHHNYDMEVYPLQEAHGDPVPVLWEGDVSWKVVT